MSAVFPSIRVHDLSNEQVRKSHRNGLLSLTFFKERYLWMGDSGALLGDLGSSLAGQEGLSLAQDTSAGNGVTTCNSVYMFCSPPVGLGDANIVPSSTSLPVSSPQPSQNVQNGQNALNPAPYIETMHSLQNICHRQTYLNILIQPINRIRYRYRSEKGSHGGLTGKTSVQTKKTYPTVRLENYRGNRHICIRASLYTNEEHPKLHVHKLMGRNCNEDGVCTIHLGEDMTAVFQNLGILFAGKKEVPEILYQRKLADFRLLKDFVSRGEQSQLTEAEEHRLREESEREAKDMNLNSVRICFEALAYNPQTDLYETICPSVFSDPIANQKSPDFGELKISRIDKCSGVCVGGDEVFLLCEKVNKKEIKVRFFEIDNHGKIVWESFGCFTETDVHHQVAIVFRTPPYHNTDIEKPVQVFLQLFRTKDGECSDPKAFLYKPVENDRDGVERKRRKFNYNPGYDGPTNNFGIRPFSPGPSDGDNGNDDTIKGFFGQSPQGYQRQVMVKEENDSSDLEKVDTTVDDAESLDSQKLTKKCTASRLPADHNSLINHVQRNIAKKSLEVQNCVRKVLYEAACSIQQRPSQCLSENISNHSLSETEKTVSNLIGEFSSYVTSIVGKLHVNAATSVDERILSLLCEKRINNQLQEITRRIAREEALSIQSFAATGDVRQLLVSKHHLLSVGNNAGDTPLHLTLLHQPGNIPLIQTFLDVIQGNHNPLNHVNNLHQTSLHLAVRVNPNVIPVLLLHGADPNIQDRYGNTAIHLAVEENNEDCLLKLLRTANYRYHENNYPRLSTLNYSGQSPLHLAVIKGHIACVQQLCRSGADVNQQEGTHGRCPLHLAIEYNPEILSSLILQECNVNIQDYSGNTPLRLASAWNLKDVVTALLAAGADPNIMNDNASTSGSEDDDEMNDSEEDNETYDEYLERSTNIAEHNQEAIDALLGAATVERMDTLEQQSDRAQSLFDKKDHSASDFHHDTGMDKKHEDNATIMDSGFISGEITMFREETVKAICDLLDPPSKEWEKLAIYLDTDEDLQKASSPTRLMIKNFQQHGNIDIFINALEAAQLDQVIDIVRQEQY